MEKCKGCGGPNFQFLETIKRSLEERGLDSKNHGVFREDHLL